MVTINLRNVAQVYSSSVSPSPSAVVQPAAIGNATDPANEQVQESVEDSEVDMVPAPQGHDIARPNSPQSASPPIEVIPVQSDEDMLSDQHSAGLSIIEDDPTMTDPIHDFPFNEPGETMEGMVVRLTNYLGTRKAYFTLPEKLDTDRV